MSGSETVCLIGWGAIGIRVAQLLEQRRAPVRIMAVAVRNPDRLRAPLPQGARLVTDPSDLPDAGLVVEAAGRGSVMDWGRAVLSRGMDFAVSSASAFVAEGALDELRARAARTGAQVLVPPGALGGIDALAAASRLGLAGVEHRIVKPARAWAGTRAAEIIDLDSLTEPVAFFEGSAREAADAFPQNANVAVITALAGVGLDRTRIVLVADPMAALNSHEIRAEGDFGTLEIRLMNRPLATNPKSSEMTALNLVRMIENRAAALVL